MKKYTLFIVALLLMGGLRAQTISVGVRGGLSIPNLSASDEDATPLSKDYKSRVGPGFALFAEFALTDHFSLQPALEYSSQGGQKDRFQAFEPTPEMAAGFQAVGQPVPEYLYADFKSVAKFNYLLVPILAKMGWDLGNSPFRFYVDAGPFVGFLLNAKQVTSGTSALYVDEGGQMPVPNPQDPSSPLVVPLDAKTDIKDDLHKVNVGVEGHAGFSYKVKRSTFFIEGGGNYGFIKIQKDARNGKNNTGAGTVMLGYAIDL